MQIMIKDTKDPKKVVVFQKFLEFFCVFHLGEFHDKHAEIK